MYKLEVTHFHRQVRRINVHRGIPEKRNNVETHLCDRKMPCCTYQTHDDQAAVYGVRLRRPIMRKHDVKIFKIYHWTDSSTVLQWLQSAHKKQQVFVANRAAEILENYLSKASNTQQILAQEEGCPSKASRSPCG